MVAVRMRKKSQFKRKVIVGLTALAVLVSTWYWFAYIKNDFINSSQSHYQWVSPESRPFNEYDDVKNANHLVMVAGHSVTISGHLLDAGEDENDWFLLDYQKKKGLPQTIIAHIREGIRQTSMDPKSILIFSGGETRSAAGPFNEGSSYFRVADAMNLWDEHSRGGVRTRTTTEEFAEDSFENLLYSICRFYEVTGSYPEKITTISFSFKEMRFKTLHAKALHWPSQNFSFIGVDPDASTGFDLEAASKGESENAAKPFENDPYGCNTDVLKKKRMDRNPFHRTPPYELSCPDMRTLLNWCGPQFISVSEVPWNNV